MFSHRKDLGVRTAGEKAQMRDEFITKSQLVAGTNITIDYLSNFDIMISSFAGGGGGGGAASDRVPRDIYVELQLVRPFYNKWHMALYDDKNTYDGTEGTTPDYKYFGTHVFAEIRHNWNLNQPDAFQYSVVDSRYIPYSTTSHATVASLPQIVGIDNNKLRIIGTDAYDNVRKNPMYWVDTKFEGGQYKMKNTRLLNFQSPIQTNIAEEEASRTHYVPTYRIRITEVCDYELNRKPILYTKDAYVHDFDEIP